MKTPNEINAAIAESMRIVSRDQHGNLYHTSAGYVRDCPNYHGSLDAIVPVVRALTEPRQDAAIEVLGDITAGYTALATPAEWSESYLKAEGLWQ